MHIFIFFEKNFVLWNEPAGPTGRPWAVPGFIHFQFHALFVTTVHDVSTSVAVGVVSTRLEFSRISRAPTRIYLEFGPADFFSNPKE